MTFCYVQPLWKTVWMSPWPTRSSLTVPRISAYPSCIRCVAALDVPPGLPMRTSCINGTRPSVRWLPNGCRPSVILRSWVQALKLPCGTLRYGGPGTCWDPSSTAILQASALPPIVTCWSRRSSAFRAVPWQRNGNRIRFWKYR